MFRPAAFIESLIFKHKPLAFMDCSFNKVRAATKFRPDFVDGHDEPARAQSHQLAERSHALAVQPQRLLPAQDALK